jgi:hypothetical protein
MKNNLIDNIMIYSFRQAEEILKSAGTEDLFEKAVAQIGEIRHWADGDFKKVSQGKWVRVSEQKEKKIGNSPMLKIIGDEIDKMYDKIRKHRNEWEKGIQNPHKFGEPGHYSFYEKAWKDERESNEFLKNIISEMNDLQAEFSEIKQIAYATAKLKREQKAGKHEVDEQEAEEIIKKFKKMFYHVEKNYPKHLSAVQRFSEITADNYYCDTETTFQVLYSSSYKELENKWNELKQRGDLIYTKSPKSDSEYLIDEATGDVYRYSDHWGRVATCRWWLKNENGENSDFLCIAKSNLSDFKRREDSVSIYINPDYNDNIIKISKKVFPKLKKIIKEGSDFYLTKGAKKAILNYSQKTLHEYINTTTFSAFEVLRLKGKYSLE